MFNPGGRRVYNSEVVSSRASVIGCSSIVPNDNNFFWRFKVSNSADVTFASILKWEIFDCLFFGKTQDLGSYWVISMSPVSLVFHTIVTMELMSKMLLEQRHLFYTFRYPCFYCFLKVFLYRSTRRIKKYGYKPRIRARPRATQQGCAKCGGTSPCQWS